MSNLLDGIPEELLDVPRKDLEGLTPRQVVERGHTENVEGNPACMACRSVLKGLAGESGR